MYWKLQTEEILVLSSTLVSSDVLTSSQPSAPAQFSITARATMGTVTPSGCFVPIEKIARLVGHTGTTTTETVYRKQIRPVVVGGADVMDSLFPRRDTDA
jgi:hypothetical protein